MSGSLKTALFGIIAYLHCTYMYMSGQRGFFLTFQSLSYPLTLMTFEDLTKKKSFPPKISDISFGVTGVFIRKSKYRTYWDSTGGQWCRTTCCLLVGWR